MEIASEYGINKKLGGNLSLFISFVCLFVKCFGSPHSGESEVIYLHVLSQSTTKGGCQCISFNRKVPLIPISF